MSDKSLDNNIIRFDWAMKRIRREVVNIDLVEEYFARNRDQLLERISDYPDEVAESFLRGLAQEFDEGVAEGRAEGIAIGEARGEKNAKLDIARNLLAMGMPAEQVAQATGLSAEEISQMQ